MDPLSIATSALQILPVIKFSVRSIKQIWDAPEDLQNLFSEVSQLITVVDGLDALGDIDASPLQPTITRLHDARKLFEEQLSKTQKKSKERFTRKSWMKNQLRIRKVIKDVSRARNDLMASMLLIHQYEGPISL